MNKAKTDSKSNTVDWKTINWRKVERYVFKLQKRIYEASRCGDVKRVRKLQRTLMRSWSNRVLAVRKVTQDNRGKKTSGVDGVKSLTPKQRMNLVGILKLLGKAKPTRRVWIPKPGREEKRPLGIPTMYDRALQAVVKAAIEPEWEAIFEPSSYGFRPGRSCHDAIQHIKLAVKSAEKFVLDADIAKCFDRINHNTLLRKLGYAGTVRRQIKAWLKAGVLDQGVFSRTEEGTPQGGVISPLLANVALHGLEIALKGYAERAKGWKGLTGNRLSKRDRIQSLTFIRYADDFVVLHHDKKVVLECKEIISTWLQDIGLELKPEKTRLTHTLKDELSEDKKAGFDFLGFHILQYKVGKHKSDRSTRGKILGFDTLITPAKKKLDVHQLSIKEVIDRHRKSPQEALIKELNPKIKGWVNYYKWCDAKTNGDLSKQDYLTYQKLRSWAVSRIKKGSDWYIKYWHEHENRKTFSTSKEENALRLQFHSQKGEKCSSTDYVKVKGDKSPYDGDWVYWSSRMGSYPGILNKVATLLKKQKGKCTHCGQYFTTEDVMEVDHIIPKAKGGKNKMNNYQLLHGHCHDEKTREDMKVSECEESYDSLGKTDRAWAYFFG